MGFLGRVVTLKAQCILCFSFRISFSSTQNNDGVAPIDNIKSPELLKIVNEASRAKTAGTAAPGGAATTTPKKAGGGGGGEDSDENDGGEGLYTKKNWIKDEEASACMNCSTPFTFMNRRVRALTIPCTSVADLRYAVAPLQGLRQDFLRQVLR